MSNQSELKQSAWGKEPALSAQSSTLQVGYKSQKNSTPAALSVTESAEKMIAGSL